jgi:glucan 1,3-beta-glucosidase
LPSPANQARVIQDVLALAKHENFKVNVIESFDAPWKRVFEGTVGGHWGLLDDASRSLKFEFGQPVSNHPGWVWQALGGIAFAALVFATAVFAGGARRESGLWAGVSANALAGGILIGWAVENVPLESLGAGQWLRSLALVAIAAVSPVVASAALARGTPIPRLSRVLGPSDARKTDAIALIAGIVLMAAMLLAIQVALGLVFDPRYKDFPFAPLTAAVVPLAVLALRTIGEGTRGAAEIAGAGVLLLSIIYIVPNEGFANWQSLWLCAVFAVLAFTLLRVRDAPN